MSYITIDSRAPTWAQVLVTQINKWLMAIRPDNAVAITGGSINGTTVGLTTAAAGTFTTTQVSAFTATGLVTLAGGAVLAATTNALTDGAGGSGGTLLNAPAVGNPTKWIAVNDGGVTRHIPAW